MAAGGAEISQFRFRLRELSRQIWVRVTAFAVLGVLTAVAGFLLKGLIPDQLPAKIGADAIESILQILASSMLAVTTFSLSILTAAYAASGTTTTPRAVGLLVSDPVSQTVLATFMGAFLFSLVGIILLKTEIYGDSGRLVLFGVTLLVVAVVVVSLLRWIGQLGRLGRVDDTLQRVSRAASESMARRLQAPWMGANPLRGPPPPEATPICPDRVGYLQHCDMARLSRLADEAGLLVYLQATPGDFLNPAFPVMSVRPMPAGRDEAEALRARLLACLTVGDGRDFQQDPRYGLQILSEIGQRALSPAVNDPGTAILAAGHMLKVLMQWRHEVAPVVEFPRLYLPSLHAEDLAGDGLLPLARDGADNFQLQIYLQKALLALGAIAPAIHGPTAAKLSQDMLQYSQNTVALKTQREILFSISGEIVNKFQINTGNKGTSECGAQKIACIPPENSSQ